MIERVAEIVRLAGAAATDTRLALRDGFLISEKNLVAAGANAVERALKRRLLAMHSAAWISPASPSAHTVGDAWVVAPLTGQRDYAREGPDYGVAVALVRAGEVIVSVVHSPGTGSLYQAEKGSGTWSVEGRRCSVSAIGAAASAELVARALPLALATVASGGVASVLSNDHFAIWDVAAGALLVTEAGGLVLDGHGTPPPFIHPDQHVRGIRAGTLTYAPGAPVASRVTNICNA
jgi:myo-inositol-1(or 4)-monophosphatase